MRGEGIEKGKHPSVKRGDSSPGLPVSLYNSQGSSCYFAEAAQQIGDGRWPQAVVESTKPFVAVVCNLAPLELIHAAGALPVRLCAGAVSVSQGDEFTSHSKIANHKSAIEPPRDMCQVVKGAAGRLSTLREQTGRDPIAVIVPSTCDWKTHCCGFLGVSDKAYTLEVPRDKSSALARRAWRRQITELADFLGRLTGTPITRSSLLHSIRLYQQASALGRRLSDLMKQPNPPIAGADLLLVFNLFYFLPVETWIFAAAELLRKMEESFQASAFRSPNPKPQTPDPRPETPYPPPQTPEPIPARLLLVGAPIIWPNWTLPRLIESLGGVIVADALCSGYRGFSDLVSVDETTRPALIESLADRYLLPCTCPCFTPNEEYLWRVENLAEDFHADGAIIHRLRNCYLYEVEAQRLEEMFRARNLPSLQVESDYESPVPAALATRVEAFLDLLKADR